MSSNIALILVLVAALSLSAEATESQKNIAFLGLDPIKFTGTLDAAGDASCATGLLSLPTATESWQVCCPKYCGSCTDYQTCAKVDGQDSRNACCASSVHDLQCGRTGAAANVCLNACSKHGPPCIMDTVVVIPEVSHSASDDCNEAVTNWRAQATSAMDAAKDQVKKNEMFAKKAGSFQDTATEYSDLVTAVEKSTTTASAKYEKDNERLKVTMRDGTIAPEFRDRQRKYVESIRTLVDNVDAASKVCAEASELFDTERNRDLKMSGQLMTAEAKQDELGPKMDDVRNAVKKLDLYLSTNPDFPEHDQQLKRVNDQNVAE